jgi:hypothetical protein
MGTHIREPVSWDENSQDLIKDLRAFGEMIRPRKWPKGGLEVEFCPECNFRWVRAAGVRVIERTKIKIRYWFCSNCQRHYYRHGPLYLNPQVNEVTLEGNWTI